MWFVRWCCSPHYLRHRMPLSMTPCRRHWHRLDYFHFFQLFRCGLTRYFFLILIVFDIARFSLHAHSLIVVCVYLCILLKWINYGFFVHAVQSPHILNTYLCVCVLYAINSAHCTVYSIHENTRHSFPRRDTNLNRYKPYTQAEAHTYARIFYAIPFIIWSIVAK